jgi:hypothetical protein
MRNRLVKGVVVAANARNAAVLAGRALAAALLEMAAMRRPTAHQRCRAIGRRRNATRATIGPQRDPAWYRSVAAIELAVGPAAPVLDRELVLVLRRELVQGLGNAPRVVVGPVLVVDLAPAIDQVRLHCPEWWTGRAAIALKQVTDRGVEVVQA